MQCAVVEFAQNVAGMKGAASTETNTKTPFPVIALMEDQKNIKKKVERCVLVLTIVKLQRGVKLIPPITNP